jgi:high-affinity nickel permease
MEGLDNLLASQLEGRGLAFVLVIAFLLGLRHAADPDHLVAVSTLVASVGERRGRVGARLGAAWGLGHAVTLVALGFPVVLVHAAVHGGVQRAAEALVGAIIVVLAIRLLRAWRRGAFHAHVHEHEGERHAHVHAHVQDNGHVHEHRVRTAPQAFGIGLVHGAAGSGGVAILLLASLPSRTVAAAALAVLAAGTALSMTILSAGLGSALGTTRALGALRVAVPVLGIVALAFGGLYTIAAFA